MTTKKYILFPSKFPSQLEDWKKQQKKQGKPSSQYEFAKLVGVDPYYITDWKTGRSGIPYKYIDDICNVLGVSPEVYEPVTHDEQYKHISSFITEIGKKHVTKATEIGLDLDLIKDLSKIIDFDGLFPIYADIVPKKKLIQTDDSVTKEKIEYVRNDNSDSAPIDKDLQFLQIHKNGKTITLHDIDLIYLKEVQDQIVDFVEYLFYKRSEEMKREVKSFNDDLIVEEVLPDGGKKITFRTIDRDYFIAHDRFAKYLQFEEEQKEGQNNG